MLLPLPLRSMTGRSDAPEGRPPRERDADSATTISPLLKHTSDSGCTGARPNLHASVTSLQRAGAELGCDGTLLLVFRIEISPRLRRSRTTPTLFSDSDQADVCR
jgi:hypothetical protein